MITQTEIDQCRAANPDKWAALSSAGFKPQRIVQIIAEQAAEKAARDKENPPEQAALMRVKAAEEIVLKHLDRARLSKSELDRLITEVRAQFPELQIEVLMFDAPASDAAAAMLADFEAQVAKLKEQHAAQAARIVELEALHTAATKAAADGVENLTKANAVITTLTSEKEALTKERDSAVGDRDAAHTANVALKAKIDASLAAKSLKTAHDALA